MPIQRAALDALVVAQHHVSRQILILAAQPVGDPRPGGRETRAARIPVLIWYSAGTWSLDSLCSDLMNAKSSTCLATRGYLSQTHAAALAMLLELERGLHQRARDCR